MRLLLQHKRISERAIAENWEIKPFGRNYKCPQAIISEVLYNTALKLGDEGFQSIPNIEIIRAKKLELITRKRLSEYLS